MSEDYNIIQLLTFNDELGQYIQESREIETADIFIRSESARGLKPIANFDKWKGRFSSKKQLWTYIYNKQYHKISRNNVRISDILKNPIVSIDAWVPILETLKKHKTEILNVINSIPVSSTFWNRKKNRIKHYGKRKPDKFVKIRSSINSILDNYIKQIQSNINQAKQQARDNNEAQRKERSMFRRQKIAQQAIEYRRAIALRRSQQEKMREIAAERKRIEEDNRRVQEANRLLKEEIRRKKALKRTLKAAHAVTRIRRKGACKKYENDVNMYEKALERQEQYIAGNCNRKGCNDDDIDNLDIYKKKIEESKKTQQTAIDNNQCPRTVKLKF